MDIKTLCLGLLTYEDASGYDLKKHFEGPLSYFFRASFGSIYPALNQLADAGLVSCETVEQDGRPDRKVYRITQSGREHFEQALMNETPEHRVRSGFLAMMYFAHLLDSQLIDSILDQQIGQWQQLREHLAQGMPNEAEPDSPGVRFVAGFGEALSAAAIAYLEENRGWLVRETGTFRPPARGNGRTLASAGERSWGT